MRLVDRVGERREPGDFARIDHKHQTRTSSRQRHQREGTSLGVEFSRGVVMGAAMHLGDTIRDVGFADVGTNDSSYPYWLGTRLRGLYATRLVRGTHRPPSKRQLFERLRKASVTSEPVLRAPSFGWDGEADKGLFHRQSGAPGRFSGWQ